MLLHSDGFVRTVLGDIPPGQLGHTQCHEHIWLRKGPYSADNPALCIEDADKSLQELREYRCRGGCAIVDAQPGGFGRDARILHSLSRESGVHIIASTGFHKRAFAEEVLQMPTQLTDRFIREITCGMLQPDGTETDIRAGLIKTALEAAPADNPDAARWFTAAAEAAKVTGAPVLVHTEKTSDVLALISWFSTLGVPASQLIISHLDRTRYDPAYHGEVLATGCYLCYDSIHRLKYVSQAQELALIERMLSQGFAGQLLLGLDTTAARLRAYGAPDMGLDYILQAFFPALNAAGVEGDTLSRLCTRNPATALQIRRT